MAASRLTRFVCGCSWSEVGHPGDCDEIVVRAKSDAEAVRLAEAKWREEILSKHPGIALDEVFVIRAGRRMVWTEFAAAAAGG